MKALMNISIAPSKKAAPEKCTGAVDFVKYANKPVIIGGPMMDVILIKLVIAPCSSPWALASTLALITD